MCNTMTCYIHKFKCNNNESNHTSIKQTCLFGLGLTGWSKSSKVPEELSSLGLHQSVRGTYPLVAQWDPSSDGPTFWTGRPVTNSCRAHIYHNKPTLYPSPLLFIYLSLLFAEARHFAPARRVSREDDNSVPTGMDDYTRQMMDLKTLVTRTLEKKGVLAKIRVKSPALPFPCFSLSLFVCLFSLILLSPSHFRWSNVYLRFSNF